MADEIEGESRPIANDAHDTTLGHLSATQDVLKRAQISDEGGILGMNPVGRN